jgi:alanine dehydrogenase
MSKASKPVVDISYSYNVLEESLELLTNRKDSFIGIPRETLYQEKRVPLTPAAVSVLVNNGHKVWIETNSGIDASYDDQAYSEAGAKICYDKKEIFSADTILKTAPISDEEVDWLQEKQVVISPLHLPSLSKESLQKLLDKKIIGLSLADIKDENDNYPIVQSMSQMVGVYAIQTAAYYLSAHNDGRGVLLGGVSGVPPTKVVILGAGMVAFSAAKAALGLGASVQVFDTSINRLMRLQKDLKDNIYTSILDTVFFAKALKSADVLIGAVKPKRGVVPMIVQEEMVQSMKPGAVIIDVNIDKGGCIETSEMTSHEKPTFTKHDVIHYCVPNMTSAVPKTASQMISNVLMPLLVDSYNNEGGIVRMIRNKRNIIHAVYAFEGRLTHKSLADRFDMKYTHLDLILPIEG